MKCQGWDAISGKTSREGAAEIHLGRPGVGEVPHIYLASSWRIRAGRRNSNEKVLRQKYAQWVGYSKEAPVSGME